MGMSSFSAVLEKGDTASLALGAARGTAARYDAREETETGGDADKGKGRARHDGHGHVIRTPIYDNTGTFIVEIFSRRSAGILILITLHFPLEAVTRFHENLGP